MCFYIYLRLFSLLFFIYIMFVGLFFSFSIVDTRVFELKNFI